MGTLGFPSFLGKVFPSLNGVLTLPQEEWFSLERGHWGGALVQLERAASVHSFTRNSAMTLLRTTKCNHSADLQDCTRLSF